MKRSVVDVTYSIFGVAAIAVRAQDRTRTANCSCAAPAMISVPRSKKECVSNPSGNLLPRSLSRSTREKLSQSRQARRSKDMFLQLVRLR